ncbi:unnamed protein product [Tetraodon nigroviridis]|uniref:(spotted green pufferfish) hypothetical protein n=1 Tax=Tetraodon nigroviridis TaxID=99883 RepID=Q4S2Y9_TETNG|nr:unnamed protein product [Tetraodon nigroviridis]
MQNRNQLKEKTHQTSAALGVGGNNCDGVIFRFDRDKDFDQCCVVFEAVSPHSIKAKKNRAHDWLTSAAQTHCQAHSSSSHTTARQRKKTGLRKYERSRTHIQLGIPNK